MGIRSNLARLIPRTGRAATVVPVVVKPSVDSIDGPKLNLGCGFDIREGWINVDLHDWHNPDIVADVTHLAPIADGYARYALAQDILEHIHRNRCQTALREWNRVLAMGGLLEVRVPDVMGIVDLMRQTDRANPEGHAVLLQCMFGTQSYEGDFHLNGFTEISLRSELAEAGFEIVYLGHFDEWLFEVVARKSAHVPPDDLLRAETDAAFVTGAYQRHLGRMPDSEGEVYFIQKLQSGTPREVVLATLKAARE